jgi:sulfate permease, SulP family
MRLDRLVPAVTAGLIIASLEVVLASSFGALIFAGDLSRFVNAGIGLNLVAAIIIMSILALGATQAGTVGSIQDVSAAVLALIAAGIVARLGPDDPRTFLTVVLAIGLTSIVTGGTFFLLGSVRLGDLVRFVPYPVVGGFLAGTGWLLFKGGMGVMTGTSLTTASASRLFTVDVATRWIPGLVVAVTVLVLLRLFAHFLIIPAALLGSVVLFYLVVPLSGSSIGQAQTAGWLLGPLPGGQFWHPWMTQALGHASWGAIASQAGNIATVVVIALLTLLLNASGIELLMNRDVDLNRELRAAGAANLVSGAAGGVVGFHALSLSALSVISGARSRVVGLTSAVACGAVLLFGTSLVAHLPRFVLGGLVLFLGLAFLTEWLVDSWSRLSRAEYAVVVLILLVVAFAGFLEGVALGLVMAVILFVVNYSRTDVVRHTLSAATFSSNVERAREDRDLLREMGEETHVLELQGFVFFGTAKALVDRIAARAADRTLPPLRFLVLDFRRVNGVDSSAILGFTKVVKLGEAHGFRVVLAGVEEPIRERFARGGFDERAFPSLMVFRDLDHGMEWCEEQLLAAARAEEPAHADATFAALAGGVRNGRRLKRYLDRVEASPGEEVIRQGDRADALYFLESGRLSAHTQGDLGDGIRLRTMGPGTVVGELPLYLQTERTASVVADAPSVLYRLSVKEFRRMEREDPDLAASLHRQFATLLARRLVDSQRAMTALLD